MGFVHPASSRVEVSSWSHCVLCEGEHRGCDSPSLDSVCELEVVMECDLEKESWWWQLGSHTCSQPLLPPHCSKGDQDAGRGAPRGPFASPMRLTANAVSATVISLQKTRAFLLRGCVQLTLEFQSCGHVRVCFGRDLGRFLLASGGPRGSTSRVLLLKDAA